MIHSPIVLFDGICNFCNASVLFLVDHDRAGRLRFAALQSATGQTLLQQNSLSMVRIDTLVLIEGNRASLRSTAALRTTRYLDMPFPLLSALLLVPTFLRDWVYDLVAFNRYRWFGRLDACRIPTPELRQRFLD